MWFEGMAAAQSAAGSQAAGGEQVLYTTVVPLAILFGVFYFVLIRPQTKRAGEHQKMLTALKLNDEVVTTGGLIGKIVKLGDKILILEIAQGVRVRVERPQVASLLAKSGKSGDKEQQT